MNSHNGIVPKAKGSLLFGNTLKVLKDPLAFLSELRDNYGAIVKVKLGTKSYYVVQQPEASKYILQEHARNYYKPGAAKLFKLFLGEGLATSNGDYWLKQRRALQPAFHKQTIQALQTIIQSETDQLVSRWKEFPDQYLVSIDQEFLRLTLSNITRSMFSLDIKQDMDKITRLLNGLLSYASKWTASFIKIDPRIPTPSNQKFWRSRRQFDNIIYEIIRKRQEDRKNKNEIERNDLLELLMKAAEDSGQTMTKEQLRDEISTIFMAGHETTAQTLSWIFYHLAKYPIIYEKLAKEADQSFNESTPNFPETRKVIEETLRLYPPVWVMARKSLQADTISGYYLPKGSTVLINVYGMHRNSKFWNHADQFDPEHFNSTNALTAPPFSYLPFGGGQRLCIGNHFAMMVMQTVISSLVREFEFVVPEGFQPIPNPTITLRAKNGIALQIKKRVKPITPKHAAANS